MTFRLVSNLLALSVSVVASPIVVGGVELAAQTSTATLQGHVRDTAGLALVSAHVIFLGTQHQALTDSTGFYTIHSVPPGSYDVEAHANGKEASRVTGLRVNAGDILTQDFRMVTARPTSAVGPTPRRSTADLQGFVRDSAGLPVQHALVAVVGTSLRGIADSRGCYRIEGIPPGSVTLRASFVGYRPHEAPDVAISAGETTSFDLKLAPIPLSIQVERNAFEHASITTREPVPEFGLGAQGRPAACR